MGLTERELCSGTARWYALRVRHQHERPAERILRHKGWETLAPFYRTRRTWSDRTTELEFPLFAGYVFCRFHPVDKAGVLNTPGVARIVGFGGAPAPVEEREIEDIRRVACSGLPVRPWPYLKAGDRVRLERGPLRGLEGTLLTEKRSLRLVVSVELLQRSLAVELDPDAVSPLRLVHRAAAAGWN